MASYLHFHLQWDLSSLDLNVHEYKVQLISGRVNMHSLINTKCCGNHSAVFLSIVHWHIEPAEVNSLLSWTNSLFNTENFRFYSTQALSCHDLSKVSRNIAYKTRIIKSFVQLSLLISRSQGWSIEQNKNYRSGSGRENYIVAPLSTTAIQGRDASRSRSEACPIVANISEHMLLPRSAFELSFLTKKRGRT